MIDWQEIAAGLCAGLGELDGVVAALLLEQPWLLALVCLWCGLWVVEFLGVLTRLGSQPLVSGRLWRRRG